MGEMMRKVLKFRTIWRKMQKNETNLRILGHKNAVLIVLGVNS